MNSRVKDETGNRYNRWLVIEYHDSHRRCARWLCRCDCGNESIVVGTELRRGDAQSCGCLNREITSKLMSRSDNKCRYIKYGSEHHSYKHGMTGSKEYQAMKARERRARQLNQTPILTENEKRKIELYYYISNYLGDEFQVDHVHPLSKGGLHHPDNLQILTKEKNSSKSNKLNTNIKGFRI